MSRRLAQALCAPACACALAATLVACGNDRFPVTEDPAAVHEMLLSNQRQVEATLAERIELERQQSEAARFSVALDHFQAAERLMPAERSAQVASLMMVGVRNFDDALSALQQGAGGIFIGSWTDPALLTQPGADIAALHAAVGRPFSVSIDAEGGRVQRQPALFGSVPSPREIAATTTPDGARAIAFDLGTKLRAKGITVDFAPLLDVDSGASTSAIGDRSFSGDPQVAAAYGAAFAQGLSDAKVRPVYKHFPGHGRTSGDSHVQAVTSPPLADVLATDLQPYGPALKKSPAAAMVGHVSVPGLGNGGPASLNPDAYAMLRQGSYPGGSPFTGVIYTDDLSGMKAISSRLSTPRAVAAALAAGADCALWISARDLPAAIDATEAALDSGSYDPAQMRDSVMRVKLQLVGEML